MSESMFTKRLFIAAPIESAEVQTELVAVRSRVQAAFPDVKFHWENQSHITLRFLGDVDMVGVSSALRELQKDLKQIAEENDPFDLALGYLYTFPGILWSGLAGFKNTLDRLDIVAIRINRAVRDCGFPVADHDFKGHITIGRFEPKAAELKEAQLTEVDSADRTSFHIDRIELMESFRDIYGRVTYRPVSADFQFKLHDLTGNGRTV